MAPCAFKTVRRQEIMGAVHTLLKPVIDFALPPRCPICGITVDLDHHFCLTCWRSLDFLGEPFCHGCGVPFAYERPADSLCATCLAHPPEHDGVRAVVRYDDISSLIAMRLKYGSRLGLANLIAKNLERFAKDICERTLIIPVPLHRWRLWTRGFNQSVLIGRALSKSLDVPMSLDAVLRSKATPPLRSMSSKKRQKTVGNAFALSAHSKALISGRPILLIDDIYTSGATTNACAKLLKRAGASQVLVFCWARVLNDGEAA